VITAAENDLIPEQPSLLQDNDSSAPRSALCAPPFWTCEETCW
jgi:hypothetical protein